MFLKWIGETYKNYGLGPDDFELKTLKEVETKLH